ncbi:hypothetical protein CCACVL1_09913 [Corchorus capsularis]|uniref:BHLH domain-containing protein n=1 Tax=Corchorus capsularis TaxID=210143 RepID=A0A1R3ITQ3_COCAP|nr:hypothetical protein CCACVL1_09913 [Corchorus capsularis]
MFPTIYNQNDDEFLYEISGIPHYMDFGQQNLTISGQPGITDSSTSTQKLGKGRRLKKSVPIPNNDGNGETNDAKKIMRKEIERQRRQQMANLSAQLRSLLPVESIKGKRAVSDHMNEAVNYIKYLRKRIQELSVKREKLKKLSGNFDQGTSATSSNSDNNSSSQINCVAIHPYCGGVEIVINSGFGDESSHLSLIMQAIIEEGLDVIRCVSSQMSEGFCHTIQSEISDPTLQLDLPGLQSRLNDLIL